MKRVFPGSKIQIVGSIDEDSFRDFSQSLFEIETSPTKSRMAVEIEINSGGGTAMDALAFYGRIKRSPCVINITAYGLVASAAVLVFAACEQRRMTKECWMMVHEDQDSLKNASVSEFEKRTAHSRRLENQWSKLLEDLTGTSQEIWLNLHKETTYLSADECKALGIATEVI